MIVLVSHGCVRFLVDPTPRDLQLLEDVRYDPAHQGRSLLDICRELNDDYGEELYDFLLNPRWKFVTSGWKPPRPIRQVFITHIDCIV